MATPILDYAHPNISQLSFNFHEPVLQHAKNQAFSSICYREIVDLKILQSYWLRAFCPISPEPGFFPNMGFVQEYKK